MLEFIDGVLAGGDRPGDVTRRARQLFQQLSSPAMAKGVEDTLFYRDHPPAGVQRRSAASRTGRRHRLRGSTTA